MAILLECYFSVTGPLSRACMTPHVQEQGVKRGKLEKWVSPEFIEFG